MIIKCFECQQEFKIPEEIYKDEYKFFCSIECAVYAGYFSVTKGRLLLSEAEFCVE